MPYRPFLASPLCLILLAIRAGGQDFLSMPVSAIESMPAQSFTHRSNPDCGFPTPACLTPPPCGGGPIAMALAHSPYLNYRPCGERTASLGVSVFGKGCPKLCRAEETGALWEQADLDCGGMQVKMAEVHRMPGGNGYAGKLFVDAEHDMGIVAHWDLLGDQMLGRRMEDLVLGDINATVILARTDWGQMRTGVGLRWLADRGQTEVGYNLHCAGDFFTLPAGVLSTSIDAGAIGDTRILRLRGSIDLIPDRVEAFGGYDHLAIGRMESQGPLMGLRLRY